MIMQIKQKIQNENLMLFLLAAIIFFIPLSPTLKSISIILTTGFIFFMRVYRERLHFIISQQCSVAAIAVVCVALLACFWSAASYQQQYFSIEKYFKLTYIPLLAVGFTNKKSRTVGIHVFLFSSLIVCLLSMCKNWNLLHYKSLDPGEVFHNHIVTGYMMAFAAYLAGVYAIRTQRIRRIAYLLLAFLLSYQVIFVNTGRTGYVVYFILLALLFAQCLYSKRLVVGLFVYSVVLGAVIMTVPSALSTGLTRAVENFYSYHHDDKNTSVGFRLQFHQYAKSLFLSSPILGHGTGGFSAQFRLDNPIPIWGKKLNDPHSQYWLIASEFGLLGIVALCYFFMSLLLISFRLVEMKAVLLGLLIPFFFANISDCFLTNTGIGYLFVMFSALCLGEFIENHLPTKSGYRSKRIKQPPIDKVLLDEQYFITKGQRSLIYRHPECGDLLIKVVNPKYREKKTYKHQFSSYFPAIASYRFYKDYTRELIESARLGSPQSMCVQTAIGTIDTNQGLGLIVKAEKDRNNDYAKTLKILIRTKQFDDTMQKKFDEFCELLTACDITLSDCHSRNLVYSYDDMNGDHFVLIDGIAEKTLIPVLRLSSYLRKRNRLDKIRTLKKEVAAESQLASFAV